MNKHIIKKIRPIFLIILMVILTLSITACSNSNLSGIQNQLNEKYAETETEGELSAADDDEDENRVFITLDATIGTFNNGQSTTTVKRTKGDTLTNLPTPTATGYEFVQWLYKDTQTPISTENTVETDTKLQAEWKEITEITPKDIVTVTFDFNGGTLDSNTTINVDVKPNTDYTFTEKYDTPIRNNYNFKGWSTTPSDTAGINTINVNNDTTFYAVWEPIQVQEKYVVTWKPNYPGATQIVEEDITAGTIINVPQLERENATWLGWFSSPTSTETLIAPGTTTTTVTQSQTYYARWKTIQTQTYTIKFNPHYGLIDGSSEIISRQIQQNNPIGTLPIPTRTGYTFLGWFTAETDGNQINENTIPVSSTTYYAYWQKNIPNITITFNPNGGILQGSNSITIKQGNEIGTMPTATKENYSFDGWYNDETNKKYVSTDIPDKSMTLTAHWSQINYNYTVTFTTDRGTIAPAQNTPNPHAYNMTVANGTNISMPSISDVNEYTFDGWKIQNGTTLYAPSQIYTVNASVTFIAQWTINTPTMYKITFKPQNNIDSDIVLYGTSDEQITVPDAPTAPEGYKFNGWWTEDSGGTLLQKETINAESDTTYYAHWQEKPKYTITYIYELNNVPNKTEQITPNAYLTLPSCPYTKTNYTFAGWKIVTLNKTYNVGEKVQITKDITFNAQWTLITHEVTIDAGNGTTPNGQKYSTNIKHNGSITLPSATLTNYSLEKWKSSINNQTYNAGEEVTITQDVTFTAQWGIRKYSVVYHPNSTDAKINGKNENYTAEIKHGETAPDIIPTREGYEFTGWYTSTNCTSSTKWTMTNPITADKDLYAGWKQNKTYKITYVDNIGCYLDDNITDGTPITSSGTVTITSNTLKSISYTSFKEWVTENNKTVPASDPYTYLKQNITTKTDITLYAKYDLSVLKNKKFSAWQKILTTGPVQIVDINYLTNVHGTQKINGIYIEEASTDQKWQWAKINITMPVRLSQHYNPNSWRDYMQNKNLNYQNPSDALDFFTATAPSFTDYQQNCITSNDICIGTHTKMTTSMEEQYPTITQQVETGQVQYSCNCGKLFNTKAEINQHQFEAIINGNSNHTGVAEIPITKTVTTYIGWIDSDCPYYDVCPNCGTITHYYTDDERYNHSKYCSFNPQKGNMP